MFIFILITIFVLANLVHSGLVYPDTSRPIEPFRNNVPNIGQTVLSDYTFNLRVQTPSSSYPIIKIRFPEVYTTLTTGTTYDCTFQQSSTLIAEACIVEADNTIRFPQFPKDSTSFQQITGGSASLVIKNIVNPQVTGGTGTGMFAVSTYSQALVIIDNNDAFGSIGLAPVYSYFPAVSLSNDGAPIAGYITNYILQFKNSKTIPKGSWFRLKFPSGYGFGKTLCAFLSPSMDITCSNKSDYLYMTNLSQALSPGTYRVRLRNIQNPYSKGNQVGFLFESMKEGTNTVMEQSTTIDPITITAGAINSPSITATNLNRNLRVDYTISFTPSNTIPLGGSIQVTFPNTYGALDSTCRIIRGLTASASGLLCVADSTSGIVTISGFTETPPQFIQIKIYATNPNSIGYTPQFKIASYKTYPSTVTSLIDENENAGQVNIADVDNPFLVEVDVYTAMTNTSLGGTGPLDFRLYPKTALPTTPNPTSGPYGKVWLQIPLWWSGIATYNRYRCNFGPTDSGDPNGCSYGNQVWKMNTPISKGLSQCDLPISLDYVRVSIIPGRWDFRVHTFVSSVSTTEPVEQDLWTMDIPAEPLASASGFSTSLDTGDNDAVIRVNFRTVVQVPIEGAINFNMSTQSNIYENTAAWDPSLGFNFGANDFTSISCRIMIGGQVVGHSAATIHKKANCVAFKGNSTHPAIIQIRGFSNPLTFNTQVYIDIPNIKICSDTTMNCVFELTTAYTTTLDNPYTLNYLTVNLGTIIGPNTPVLGTTASKPQFFPTMICLPADYDFTFQPLYTLVAGDHILIKFPANKFTFRRDSIGSNVGNVVVIYVAETDEIYFLIRLTITVASGALRTIRLSNVRNSNGELKSAPRVDDFSGVITKMIYWSAYREVEHITFDVTDPWTDGGIYDEDMTWFPRVADDPTQSFTRILNKDDWIPHAIIFTVCHIVNSDGGIKIEVPVADYQDIAPTCQARSGITGQTNNNGFTTLLNCWFDTNSFYVTGFEDIPQFTVVTIGFSVQSKTTASSPQDYKITTYYDSAFTQVNDYTLAVNALDIDGVTFPLKLEFVDWLSAPKLARINTLGTFKLTVNMSVGLPAWTAGPDPHILFILDNSMSILGGSGLDCRHNGLISYHCEQTGPGFRIKMPTNQFTGITKEVSIPIILTTLGAFQSSNTQDGIYFTEAGRFTLTAEAYNNGVLTESSQFEFEVFGRDFRKYWVYSINKGRGGLTLVRIFVDLNEDDYFPAADDPNIKGKIVLEFSRTFTTGFAQDLGTGIPDKGKIPCNSKGLPILDYKSDIECILLHGLYNNPTRIEIGGFNWTHEDFNPSFQIDIPNIYNPGNLSNTFDVPNVVTRIYRVNIATGDETELYYHGYDLINVTYPQNPVSTLQSVAVAPTLSLAHISYNFSTLSIRIVPTKALQPSDHIVIELPLFWKASRVITCNVGGNTRCVGYPDANWIVADIHANPIPTSGVVATFELTNPPAVLPTSATIKAYYYHTFKLLNEVSYPPLGTTLIPFDIIDANITSATSNYGIESPFVFSFIVPEGIPEGGAIQIKIPNQYILSDLSCENDGIGGSTLGDKGFQCSINMATRELIAYGFPALANNSLVVLNARLTNPAAAMSIDDFRIETHYIYQTIPLETQIAVGDIPAPPIVAPSPLLGDWNDQYHQQEYLYAEDIGPIRFKINLASVLSTTDTLIIEIPTAFDLAPDGQPEAMWDGVSALTTTWDSTVSPRLLKISSPDSVPVAANTNLTLEITSLNADQGKNGFVLPNSPGGTYSFTFKTSTNGGTTIREQQAISVTVYAKKFTKFYSTTEIINYNMKTSFKIEFQPETTVPVGGKLVLYVPTRNADGLFLFNNDLRTGVADGGSIPCHDVANSFGIEPTCTIKHGNRALGKPAEITVTGWTGPLSAGNSYSFRVNKVMNPPESGDNKHVVMRLESFNAAAIVLNAGLHYDFTIQKFDPIIWNAPSAPTTNPLNAGQSSVTFELDLYSHKALIAQAKFDYFVVEFPALIPQPLGLVCVAAGNPDCVSLPGNNWVIYDKSDANVAATTPLTTLILNAQQAIGILNSTSSVFNSYAIKNRVAVTQAVYPPIIYTSLVLQSISATITVPSVSASLIPYQAALQFLLTFTIPSGAINIVVPSSGAISFTLPSSMTAIDPFCVNDISSQLTGDYSCTLTGQVYKITGFNQLNAGTVVAITFWAQINTANTATTFDVSLYQDVDAIIKISGNAAVTGPTSSNVLGFQKLYAPDTEALNPIAIKANDIAPFSFSVTLDSTFTTQITVTFPTGVSVPTGATLVCGWGSYEAKSCTVDTTAATLKIIIESPHSPTLVINTIYKVFITSYGTTSSNKKGLMFSSAGQKTAEVSTGTNSVFLPFEIYAPDFTSSILTPFWSNANQNNYLAVLLQPSVSVPSDGKIVVRFPQFTEDGASLFAPDLGTGLSSGSSFFCTSETTSTLPPTEDQIKCQIIYGKGIYTLIEITGFNGVTAGATIEFFIGRFLNPNVPDSGHADFIVHTEDSSGAILNQRLIKDVFTPQAMTVPSTPATYGRDQHAVQFVGATYTFTSLVISKPITTRSSIILMFPATYSLSGSISVTVKGGGNAATVTFKHFANFIRITPSADFPTGSVDITVAGVTNPYASDSSAPSNPIRILFVYYRSYETDISATLSTALITGTITVPTFLYSSQLGGIETDFTFTLNVGKKIPASGVLQLSFPSFLDLNYVNGGMIISGKSPVTFTPLSATSVSFTFGRAYDPTTDGNIVLRVTGKTPSTAQTYTITINAYQDSTLTKLIASGGQSYQVTAASRPASTINYLTPGYVRTSQIYTFKASYILNSGVSATSPNEIHINIGDFTTAGNPNCKINSFTATYCGYDSDGILVIGGFTLNANPTPNIIEFDLRSPSSVGNGRIYISSAQVIRDAGSLGTVITTASSTTYLDSSTNVLTVYQNAFSAFSLTTAHLSISQPNFLQASLTLGSTAVTSPIFYVELPDFPSNLGLDSSLGTTVPCTSSTHPNIKCTLETQVGTFQRTRIKINGFSDLAASTSVSFNIFRIISPSTTDPTFIYIKLASLSVGNYENNIYGESKQFIFTNASPSPSTQTLSLGNYVVRNSQTYDLGINSVILTSGDVVFYHLPYFQDGNLANTASCSPLPCTLYNQAGVLVVPVSNLGLTSNTVNMRNPPGVPSVSTHNIVGYVVQNNAVVQVNTYTATWIQDTMTLATINPLQPNAGTGYALYSLAFTLKNSIPQGGMLRVEFPTSGFNGIPTASGLSIGSGSITGNLQIQTTNSGLKIYIDIKGFTSIAAGSVQLYLYINRGQTSGTFTGTLTSYMDTAGKIPIEYGGLSLAYSTNPGALNAYNYGHYVLRSGNTLINGNGIWSFIFKQSAGALTTSQKLRVTPPSTFLLTGALPNLPIRCKFKNLATGTSYLAQECFKDNLNQYQIIPPTSNTLAVAEWQVTIFTVGHDLQGFQFPSTPENYVFTVNIESSTGTVLESNILKYRVFESMTSTGFADSYLSNINENNLLKFKATIATTVGADGQIRIEFPMLNPLTTINSNSLFTNKIFRNIMTSTVKVNGANFISTARLLPGSSHNHKPTTIIIDAFMTGLNAGNTLDIGLSIVNGPTAELWTNARLITLDKNLIPLDFYSFEYLTYTATSTPTSDTAVFPSTLSSYIVQDLINFNLNVNPTTPVILSAADTRLRFGYNSECYGGSLQNIATHTMEFWSTSLTFVTLTSNPGTTPQSFSLNNLRNPISIAPFTSTFSVDIIKKKVKVSTIAYTTSVPTFIEGSFSIITVTPSSLLMDEISSYKIEFSLSKDIPTGGSLTFTFPTDYTLQDNSCSLEGVAFTACSVSGLSVTFSGLTAVTSSTAIKIYISAKNPSTAGTTAVFTLSSADAGNYMISTRTATGITIVGTPAFNFLQTKDLLTKLKLAQALDIAPLKFILLLASNLAPGQTNYVDFIFPTETPEYALPPNIPAAGVDLVCRWDDWAAAGCERIANGYRVYTPLENGIDAGKNYTVWISTNRYVSNGVNHPIKGTYVVDAKPNTGTTVQKYFHSLNEAFTSAFIVSRITTISQYTILSMKFISKYDLQPETDPNRAQVIVELPTMLQSGETVFPVDLGKAIQNGEPVDCVSNADFKCRLSKGGLSASAPASIIMEPQDLILRLTEVEVSLAFIQIGAIDKTYSPLRVYMRDYDATSNIWTIRQELLKEDIFYTTTSTIDTTQTGLAAPTFTPNQVGAPTGVTFNFNFKTSVGSLRPVTYDRMVIFTQTTNISIQEAGVTCTQATVTTHTISQWFEVKPLVSLGPSTTFSINFANWKNVPYVVAGGVQWQIYLWQGSNLKQIINYAFTAPAIPHAFVSATVTPYNSKVRAVSTYEFLFLPFNKIPNGGSILIEVPSTYISITPQCKIQGLVSASCRVQQTDDDPNTDDPKSIILSGFNDYDPAVDGAIKLQVTLINPKNGGMTGFFTLSTRWIGDQIIDQNLNLYNMNIDATATFHELSLVSLQQFQTKTCGGNPGPMKISFSLKNSLSYPNEYLTITLDNNFNYPDIYEEVLCYFKFDDIYNLKTHRCDWDNKVIYVYAPEEKNIPANTEIQLTITTRGADVKYEDGVSVPGTPGQYFVRVDTSNNLEQAYPIANIPACPFRNFRGESAVWDSDTNTLLNFYVTSTAYLPSSSAALPGRIVVEIPTHNEIITTYLEDLGRDIPAANNSAPIGCGSVCANCPNIFTSNIQRFGNALQPANPTATDTNIECTLMKAPGQNFGDRAIVFTTNLQAIQRGARFNFQVARIKNPVGTGWPYWTHVRIRTQKKAVDGSYIDLNDHWAYFIMPFYYPPSTPTTSGGTIGVDYPTVHHVGNYTITHSSSPQLYPGDYIIYEFIPQDLKLPNGIECDQNYDVSEFDVVPCGAARDSSWANVQLEQSYDAFRIIIFANMRTPYYVVQGGIQVTAYEVRNHQIINKVLYTPYQNYAGNIQVVMQTPSNTNDVGLTLKYQIGVFVETNLAAVKLFRLEMPGDFTNPENCVVRRGLLLQDVNDPFNPVQCVITPQSPGYLIEVYNFTWGDGWFILDLVLTNPTTPRFTGRWTATSYDNYNGSNTNYTRIMDRRTNLDGTTWVGVKPFPNLFRVYRNTKSFENRRAKEGEYGEIDMRLVTKRDIPPGSGNIQIWLPEEYNIPNGGDAICEIGNAYHTDLQAGSCTITADRKIYMDTNEITGIKSDTCSLISATTINSANGNNGFQTPLIPGSYQFQVWMYNGSIVQEYSNPSSAVLPKPLTSLNIRVVHRETSQLSVVRLIFSTPSTIPAGYDTATNILDLFSKPPIGSITVDFNTNDNIAGAVGWPLKLGFGTATDIPCKIFSGMTVKPGSKNIKCTLIPSTAANPKNPARVVISDFEQIIQGTTNIEVHLLNIQNPPAQYNYGNLNNGNIKVGAFETYGDNSTAEIIEPTIFYQAPIQYNYIAPQVWDYPSFNFINPNTVGAVLIVNFPWNTTSIYDYDNILGHAPPSVILSGGDILKLKLPSPQYNIPDDGSISAVMDGVQLRPYVYSDSRVNEIHFEVPTGKYIYSIGSPGRPDTKLLSVSQLRGMAYADDNFYSIQIWIIRNAIKTAEIRYENINPATPSDFNSLSLVLSSYFSGDVFVSYNFSIVPSYNIPKGSIFTINLPSPQYDYLFNSQPQMICSLISSTLLKDCSGTTTPGSGTTITFTANADIVESTNLNLQLTGVKNPSFVGTLPQGSVNMSIAHPNGKLINQGKFSNVTFASPKSPSKVSLTIDVTSYYKSVDADYIFSLQNSNALPIGGKIILDFAADWASILPAGFALSSLKSAFTSQTLFYTTSYNTVTKRLEITTQFAWPAKTSIYVGLKNIKNPSSITTTLVFRASTIYDGVTLDQTDPLDTSTTITFETPPPLINVTSYNISPTNEGELATYSLELSPETDLPAGSQLQLLFPSSFGPLLTTVDAKIQCSSPEMPTLSCIVQNGKLVVSIPDNVPANGTFNLVITGITNPNEGSNGAISLLTTNGNSTLQFSSNAIPVITHAAPTAFDLTKLTTSSTNLQALSTYTFCAATDQMIPPNAQVFINFPQQFTLRQSSYGCSAVADNALIYPNGVTCSIQSNIRRFVMTGQSNSLPGGTLESLCYEIVGVENPADSGETNSFSMEVFDPAASKILYRSFGTLSYPTTLTYKRVGLRILVGSINDFVKGLMSDYINVQLERSVPYEVILEPKTPGFTFDPPKIYFRPDLSAIQKFRIIPDPTTEAGSYFIQWNKTEDSTNRRFAEVPDSYFNYVATAAFNKYRVIIGTSVSRTALRGTSLPISIKLTQAPASNMTVYYNTIKPSQSEYVEFNPPYLVFQAGELEKTFQYTTIDGAVSGLIQFSLQTEFQNIYYMETDILNFEILDIDNEVPLVLNEYIVTLDRTYMYYRISTSESVWVYYLLTLKGTVAPPIDEIKNSTLRNIRGTKTDVIEITGKNSSYQADITSTYIYYDIYLKFTGLEEQTDYVLYYVVQDLSGNDLIPRKIEFTTFKKHHPAMFNILLSNDTDTSNLEAAFSLITGMPTTRWEIVKAPPKFNIPYDGDPLVKDILDAGTVTYNIMLQQNTTADEKRPIDIVSLLETNKYLLKESIPEIVNDYDINKYCYEIVEFDNQMPYQPLLVEVDEDYGTFNISLKRNGTLFGVLLLKGSAKPSARQIKYGLNASNFLVPTESYIKVSFEYANTLPYGVSLHKMASFTNLFDNTEYEAHFIGENNLPINPDLMDDQEIVTVSFLTQRELFVIPSDYQYSNNLSLPKLLVTLLFALMVLI